MKIQKEDETLLIALSPHSDDVCYSIACTLYFYLMSKKASVHIVNLFSKTNYIVVDGTEQLNKNIEKISRLRKSEDFTFFNSLGNKHKLYWFNFLDATLRGYSIRSTCRDESRFTEIDIKILKEIKTIIKSKYRLGNKIFCPLSVGNHIDHKIVTEAIVQLLLDKVVLWSDVFFYEDLPYAGFLGSHEVYRKLRNLAERLKISFSPVYFPCNNINEMRKKWIKIYKSQYSLESYLTIDSYIKNMGCKERVWICRR